MKNRIPMIVTIALIAGTLVVLSQRERVTGLKQKEVEKPEPEEVIWRMTDAARAGDSQAYLDCFTGDLQQVLRRTASDMGQVRFSQHLRELNSEVTGIAVSSPSEGQLQVEFVYRGKNESQRNYVKLVDGRWKIERVDDGEHVNALIPYGTPVKDILRASSR